MSFAHKYPHPNTLPSEHYDVASAHSISSLLTISGPTIEILADSFPTSYSSSVPTVPLLCHHTHGGTQALPLPGTLLKN